ncbi:hypothetical protein [Streptomyces sp. NBC_01257]|uniref:hypothetical protein n=1 Tax=Streptomyces sp. NBC_01257 TaxID=2903799 RepID=UPI002DD813D2|nr:hypothetical protein [Streptomyces sp. NBC_01257]WRZ67332.1 hypothetical protein OG408_27145 [Streptomyces sp. NBC_01257]
MTTPPPQPRQGPYDPQQGPYGPPRQGPYVPPQQPPQNPYGGQPVPRQPPYGYPQAPPPQPWGGPAFGGPGFPGMPPPKRSRAGLIAGIVVGALVVAGGIAFGVARLVDAADDGGLPVAGGFPAAEYRLTVPRTLLDDEYTLAKDLSSTEGREIEKTYDPSIRDAKAVVTQYTSDSGGTLVISGLWGRIKGPEFTRDKILEGAAENDGMTIAVPAREFTPDGYGITVSCQVVRSKEGAVSSTLPMCAWGDGNTASFVAVVTAETALQDPEEVDLEKAALDTAKVRAESRKPIAATEAG